jgi:hypothetical protein
MEDATKFICYTQPFYARTANLKTNADFADVLAAGKLF